MRVRCSRSANKWATPSGPERSSRETASRAWPDRALSLKRWTRTSDDIVVAVIVSSRASATRTSDTQNHSRIFRNTPRIISAPAARPRAYIGSRPPAA